MTFFYITFLHTWRKPTSYLRLSAISAALIANIFLALFIWAKFILEPESTNKPSQGEGIFEIIIFFLVLLVSVTGIFVGLIGALIRTLIKK